jgi:hypothetical protein
MGTSIMVSYDMELATFGLLRMLPFEYSPQN